MFVVQVSHEQNFNPNRTIHTKPTHLMHHAGCFSNKVVMMVLWVTATWPLTWFIPVVFSRHSGYIHSTFSKKKKMALDTGTSTPHATKSIVRHWVENQPFIDWDRVTLDLCLRSVVWKTCPCFGYPAVCDFSNKKIWKLKGIINRFSIYVTTNTLERPVCFLLHDKFFFYWFKHFLLL